MTPELEKVIAAKVRPILVKGRQGDWDHTLRTIGYARRLLEKENGDADIVIPALYLHDIGWSAIDYQDFIDATPAKKKETRSLQLHMAESARMATEILKDLSFTQGRQAKITAIIAVHDDPDKIFALNNISATLVMEADRLDRYGFSSVRRYQDMFGPDYFKETAWIEGLAMRREGLKEWFVTKTGKALAHEMAEEMGLFDQA